MVKNYKDYIDELHEEFPDLPKEVIGKILRNGISRLQFLVHQDHDVRLGNRCKGEGQYHLYIIRPVRDKFDRWQRALRRLKKLKKYREGYGAGS